MGAEGEARSPNLGLPTSGHPALAIAETFAGRQDGALAHLAHEMRERPQSRAWVQAAGDLDTCEPCGCDASVALAVALALALDGCEAWRRTVPELAALRIRNIVGGLALEAEAAGELGAAGYLRAALLRTTPADGGAL